VMLMLLALFAVLIIFTTVSFVYAANSRGYGVREYTPRLTMTTRDIILALIDVKRLPPESRFKPMGYTPFLPPPPPPPIYILSKLLQAIPRIKKVLILYQRPLSVHLPGIYLTRLFFSIQTIKRKAGIRKC
jgi:hypothetical protein